ncbi:type VI secretion protein ImpA [Chimaeribacter coloradensis]|uniref:Type VI secretion protein ImpA n=1 Tax=Chimaeribacter coloradensis TaxID=2060068 RepID=A0A2N5E828_9GAMM|nr:type VI secretion protein ImpA [Chimaeribacter coloradensis]PLR37637.1 type VI secretion protein ImpA [Chimaeribacter coloradensis]
MAVLHPLECYLLEHYSSPDYYAATRDAIIAFVDAHEAAFARYQRELPVRSRKEPLWKQGDVVWGTRVLPNIRPDRERYINAYILRTHNDPAAFNIGHTMKENSRGISEFWNGWMTDEERQCIDQAERRAGYLDQRLTLTVNGDWREGNLTYLQNRLYKLADLPKRIPRYELDHSVRLTKNDLPQQTGIYLPDVEAAPARVLYAGADFSKPPKAMQGVKRYNEEPGETGWAWRETRYAETGWTLIRRVEGEYLDVPPEGFFPQGTPDELYNWPTREKAYISHEKTYITAWSGEPAPHAGDWSVFTRQGMQNAVLRQGQPLPYLTTSPYPERAQWTLIKREDGGSVFISNTSE